MDIAIEIDPNYEDALIDKAIILFYRNRHNECLEYCDKIFKLDIYCENIQLYEIKVRSLFILNRLFDARMCADKALTFAKNEHKLVKRKNEILEAIRDQLFGM